MIGFRNTRLLGALAVLAAGLSAHAADSTAAAKVTGDKVTGDKVTLDRYLATAQTDGALRSRQGDSELEFGSYSGLPLLRDMEFRVRNDALDPSNMRYTLRLDPRGFGEGRAARRYGETEVKRSKQRNRLLLNRALVDRYLTAVDCLQWNAIHALNGELSNVLEDRIRVLDKRKATEDFDLADLVEAEADLTKLRSQDLDLQRDLDVLEQQIVLRMGGDAESAFAGFDTTGLIAVDSLLVEVEKGGYGLDSNHVYLEYLEQGLALAQTRYEMEKAGGRQYLSFLSFSYDVGERLNEIERRDDGKDYDLDRAYVLEAGFRLPFLTTGNQELNRRKEQLLSEREDYQQSRAELEAIMRKDIRDIRSLVSQYRYLRARETQVDAQASLKKYLQMSGVDPIALLSIKEGDLKNRIKLEEVKFGILRNWIKVMDASGRLAKEPKRNWLLAEHPEIKP